jgi:hydroxymethylpyrimidine pyrophosphatase-like HAD family hydrolase
MLFAALAVDYDGTLARHGRVADGTVEAVKRVKDRGKKLILVTGRQLSELEFLFDRLALFDVVVAENGALLHFPTTGSSRALSPEPPKELVGLLRAYAVDPLWIGRGVVATWAPNEEKVLRAVRELGLEWNIAFNKGAVMCLPSGVNKASGLKEALAEFKLSPLNAIGIGDAENDHAFLEICGCSAAVENAIDSLKAKVDMVMPRDHGEGVVDLIETWLDQPASPAFQLPRYGVELGRDGDEQSILLGPAGGAVLAAGQSGGGKSRIAAGLIERISARGYQMLILDPEGEHGDVVDAACVGSPERPPAPDEVVELLDNPEANLVLNLLGVDVVDRPAFLYDLLGRVTSLRAERGRPHWLIIDEAHHFLPANTDASALAVPAQMVGAVLITVDPKAVSSAALQSVQSVIAVGPGAGDTIRDYCSALDLQTPDISVDPPGRQEALFWRRSADASPVLLHVTAPIREHKRHTRKYVEGRLSDERSFYFRGPDAKLNLRASNLMAFLELAEGVDAETWLHHLRRGDYSSWFDGVIGDADLAREARAVEADGRDAETTKRAIGDAIRRRYTGHASDRPSQAGR